MCCLAAAWSILGTFLSSLARDPNDPSDAQPNVCAVLVFFLIIGCFFLSIIRIKIEKANVGGMLAATIMMISLTTAVLNVEFTVVPTVSDTACVDM
ncbi:hypothetical protein G6F36_014858 [Rhizopus arrhizus]|nr:hypothetical protein G6F36_014858 [Rhizopus arrhizus]